MLRTAVLFLLLVSATTSPAPGQALPDSALSPSLEAACRGDGTRLSLYVLQWSIRSRSLLPAERASLSPVARSAYRLVERHYRPYVDPHLPSTWAEAYRVAVLQSVLRVAVAPDSSFRRWEQGGYDLESDWSDPPVLRRVEIRPFRPTLHSDSLTLLTTAPPDRQRLVNFLLPLGTYAPSLIRRRIDCLDDVFALTDWARTGEDAHSPPRLALTMNESRTRAIAAYGWGSSGGVWVVYRRTEPGTPWREGRTIGAWRY